jgi:hypothetical protein
MNFDRVAALALKGLLGKPTKTILFARAYGDDASVDQYVRPTSFPEAIKRVRQLLQTHGQSDPPDDPNFRDPGTPARTYQDGGVDVIALRRFFDGEPAHPVVLAQCTIQKNWRTKTGDIKVDLWNGWVLFPSPFQRALIIPWSASHEGNWIDRNRMAGLVIDRMRVCELLTHVPPSQLAQLCTDELKDWLNAQRAAYVPEDAAA